jgi:hypothetical protein
MNAEVWASIGTVIATLLFGWIGDGDGYPDV